MNKLLTMMAFVRVSESGSFTAAAAQLGVSVSAVAKAVTRLEQDLGVQLLVRTTRKLALNDDGREFFSRCQRILNDIEDAESAARGARETPKGRLRMVMPTMFGRQTFLPHVAEFSARYPDIVLDLSFEDRQVNLIERGLDLAVQVGELNDSNYLTRLLHRGPRVTAASPAYLKRHGEPKTPEELTRHNCIISNYGPLWHFSQRGRVVPVTVHGNLVVTGGEAMREAALLGIGIAQSNGWTFRHDIAAGTLRPLLEAYAVEGRPMSIVYPPTRHVPSKLRVMIDFLVTITRLPAGTAALGAVAQAAPRRRRSRPAADV
jgi:DNA-binding transcriptional LysR family regulator